ncbi:hydrophobic protein [Streptomyces sp. NPDC018610]|uniref:hydrophobic protein n=1 Tax=Streptomyces sp. NPDC018610 TaxID=3365049 RepID=UPI0037AAB46C
MGRLRRGRPGRGAGFALKILWRVALIVLVVWLLGFVMRSTNAGGGRGRWYRW